MGKENFGRNQIRGNLENGPKQERKDGGHSKIIKKIEHVNALKKQKSVIETQQLYVQEVGVANLKWQQMDQ